MSNDTPQPASGEPGDDQWRPRFVCVASAFEPGSWDIDDKGSDRSFGSLNGPMILRSLRDAQDVTRKLNAIAREYEERIAALNYKAQEETDG